jgi:CBS domain containing-hemolysin-like protein
VETLAGFMLAELGHIPVVGEKVVHEGRVFKVAEMAGRRISKVKVEEKVAKAGETATEDDGLEGTG